MRKSLLLTIMMLMTAFCYSADEYTFIKINMRSISFLIPDKYTNTPIEEENKPIHRAPMLTPTVYYDASGIYISSYYELYDVEVIINDESGNDLMTTIINISGDSYIALPAEVNASKHSIELIYDECHLYGEF